MPLGKGLTDALDVLRIFDIGMPTLMQVAMIAPVLVPQTKSK